jgi:hypothetical protein
LREALGVQGPPASRPGEIPRRRTGALQRSAYARVVRSGAGETVIEVGDTAPHAAVVSRRRPFVGPVVDRIRPGVQAILFRDLDL